MTMISKFISKSITLTLIVVFSAALGSTSAMAAPIGLPFDFPVPALGSLIWDDIDNTYGDPVNPVPGSPFTGDCEPSTDAGAIAINDARSSADNGDAYDTAWLTSVGDMYVTSPAQGDLTGNLFTAVPVNISGLDVTYTLFFSEDVQCNRYVLFLDNNTGAGINEQVSIATNFGSDGSTIFEATSSGDTMFTTTDRWAVTSDTFPFSDPINTTVFFGPGVPETTPNFATDIVCDDASDEGVGVRYNVFVPAGESRCLMLFACLDNITDSGETVNGAIAGAELFNSNDTIPGDLLSGLSQQDLEQCVNWQFGAPSSTVPTLSEWGLIAMAGLLGIVGFMVIRRRQATA
ncbi:MAG: hypothetical protein DHS20C13_20190 [Thermodesulfobacteriota bacterium]|nr:MAG: hypothetical protein DHS20C13_20190 [Thermodesulfobacteriota bacterium]